MLSRFHCIQPIFLDKQTINLIHAEFIGKERILDMMDSKHLPRWKRQVDKYYNTYEFVVGVPVPELSLDDIKNDIKDNPDYQLLDIKCIKAYLMYDIYALQPILTFEIDLNIDQKKLATFKEQGVNVYKLIRSLLVREDDDEIETSRTIIYYKSDVLSALHNFMQSLYKNHNLMESGTKIIDNTGNITHVCVVDEDEDEIEWIGQYLIKTNYKAERVKKRDNKPIYVHDLNTPFDPQIMDEFYYFNGRCHTIFQFEEDDIDRFITIQYYMQSAWFMLEKQLSFVLNNEMDGIEHVDQYILKLEYINTYDNKFKLSLEGDRELYHLIQAKWNVNEVIALLDKRITEYKDKSLIEISSLKKSLYTDFLTGVHTRRWMEDNLLSNEKRFNSNGVICVIDLNDFKIINDTYGHNIGDDMLKYFASTMRKSGGEVIRLGGDEFVVIFNNMTEAEKGIEVVSTIFLNKNFKVNSVDAVKVKFSYGFETFNSDDEFKSVFDQADARMYEYKKMIKGGKLGRSSQ